MVVYLVFSSIVRTLHNLMSYSFRQNISFEQGGKQDFQYYKFVIEIYVQLLFKKKKKKKEQKEMQMYCSKIEKV